MELKKTKKADLESKKSLFFEIGLICSLLVIFIAFNWKSEGKKESTLVAGPQITIEEEVIPVTQEDQPKPQEIPQAAIATDEIVLGDNDIELDMDMSMFNAEDNNQGIKTMDYIVKKEVVKEEEEVDEVIPFVAVEERPTFMGENPNTVFPNWVQSNITFPQVAADNGIQGTVYVGFTIEKDGSLSNIKILRGVDPLLDAEAIRGVKKSPKWKPGKQRNKPVVVSYEMKVHFNLAQ